MLWECWEVFGLTSGWMVEVHHGLRQPALGLQRSEVRSEVLLTMQNSCTRCSGLLAALQAGVSMQATSPVNGTIILMLQ